MLLRRGIISSGVLSVPPATVQLHLTGDGGFKDLSTNAYTVSNTGATQTSTIYNGHKALSCDGTNDQFRVDSASTIFNTSTWDCYIVCKRFTAATFAPVVCWVKYNDSNSYSWMQTRDSDFSNGSNLVVKTSANGSQSINDTSDVGANLCIINFRLDGTDYAFKINDDTPITGTATSNRTDHDVLAFGALVRSANPSGTAFGDYDFAEIKMYDEVLGTTARADEISALATKYNITI